MALLCSTHQYRASLYEAFVFDQGTAICRVE